MSLRNGAKRDSCRAQNIVEGLRRSSSFEEFEENTSIERCLRGFEKVPVVAVPQLKQIKILSDKHINKTNAIIYKSIKESSHLKRLQVECKVTVLRHDLEKLKELFSKYPDSVVVDSLTKMVILKCKICKKVYASEKKLQNHHTNKHMIVYKHQNGKPQKRVSFAEEVIVHELKEYHKCRKCLRIFGDYKTLKVHKKQRHKKRKRYVCDYCSKEFVDRMFFKVHIKLHCNVCGILLQNRSQYLEHRRNVCRIVKIHKCKTCSESFYKFMDLKDHSYEHAGSIYVCDICKDQCEAKCILAHHIAFLHSQQRPKSLFSIHNLGSERLYLCNFCDESSIDRDLLQKHLEPLPDLNNRVMTGYGDFFFCDQCHQKFATEKDMLHHKWTHFLKTSDNSQLRQKKDVKRFYNINEKLPEDMLPKVLVQRVDMSKIMKKKSFDFVDINSFDENFGIVAKKAVVDPKSKKTLISKHQCENCGKYFSTNYCLNRHIETQHSDYENLRCRVCEETFVWPSLLKSHRCIRISRPEMPFEDARPEIHFDNLPEVESNIDDFNIEENYMNAVDFEIPAPIVELSESDTAYVPTGSASDVGTYPYLCVNGQGVNFVPNINSVGLNQTVNSDTVQSLGYKFVMHEVPIEF